ncbi:MAG: kelch repeat-containing protein [Acidimicrobiia bacterium]
MRRFMGWRVGVLLVVSSLITAACSSGTSPSDLIQVREGHTATLLENGQVLVVGGHGGQRVGLASPELFDPATGWSPASATSQAREEHTATLLSDGRVLVAGGFSDTDPNPDILPPALASGENFIAATNEVEVYDPSTNTWSPTGSMEEVRAGHTATLLKDGRVLVSGGSAGQAALGRPGLGEFVLASAELYDPSTGIWSITESMAEPRSGHSAILLADGRVLVIGGASAEAYDPSNDSWSSAGSMSEEREDHTATLLDDGRVLVVGGQEPDEGRVLASVEVFDPATGSWSAASAMEENRSDHAATLLDDGRVLIVGGEDALAEAYSPVTDSWSRAGELRKARGGFTATLLADGRVLIAGGAGEGGERPSLTEVFDPTTNSWKPAAEQQ